MYVWYLIGLPNSSIMLSARSVSCFLEKVEFLGHTVSAAGVGVVQAKVDAIKQWPQPICIKDVQAFLGLANYYRWFVKGFAQIALPLTNLTRKSQDFAWSEACEQSFRTLKQWTYGDPYTLGL